MPAQHFGTENLAAEVITFNCKQEMVLPNDTPPTFDSFAMDFSFIARNPGGTGVS
jgi:hypothetical protein